MTRSERRIVEDAIIHKTVKVVVATSTLATGVNFPLGTVVFDSLERWDDKRRGRVPLPESEFHNMAGRAGRMGSDHELGQVIFVAEGNAYKQRTALRYLDPDRITRLESRLGTSAFAQVALQLLSAELCNTEDEIYTFLLSSLSAFREKEVNLAGLEHWRDAVSSAIESLRNWGYVL